MKAKCDDCGHEVEINREGIAVKHTRTWTPFEGKPDVPWETVTIPCEGSGLRPIHVPSGEVAYLTNHFESNRRKH